MRLACSTEAEKYPGRHQMCAKEMLKNSKIVAYIHGLHLHFKALH